MRTAAASASPRPATWEWALLVALCTGCLLFWAPHHDRFAKRPSDFGSFAETAEALWSGELPASFKRMPLFPLLVGWAKPAFPDAEDPMLETALVLNLVCSLGILVGTFLLARPWIGPAALLAALLVASTRVFHGMALNAMAEPLLGVLVLATLVLFARGSPWQYAAAGLAALVRYEAAVLPPLLFALNWRREGRLRFHLTGAALAGAGVAAWMALSVAAASAAGDLANPYVTFAEESARQGGARLQPRIAWTLLRPVYGDVPGVLPVPLAALDVAALAVTAIGAAVLLRRAPFPALAVLGFAAFYLAAHLYLNVDRARYAHPVVWIPPLLGAAALAAAVETGAGRLRRATGLGAGALAAAAAGLLGLAVLGAHLPRKLAVPELGVHSAVHLGFLALLAVLALLHGLFWVRPARFAGALAGLALAGLVLPPAAAGIRGAARDVQKLRWSGYDQVLVRKWLEEHLAPHERAVLVTNSYALESGRLAAGQLIQFSELDARSHDELVAELARREVSFVVYTWRPARPADPAERNYNREVLYHERYKVYLSEPFQSGAPLPHFEPVATLPVPAFLELPAVQVYRFMTEAPARP